MENFTQKDIEFLSNPALIAILRSLLDELDVVASSGAHRSTTYLAVSAIEGLFGEILKLLRIQASDVPGGWPLKNGKPEDVAHLTLHQKGMILEAANALPKGFEKLYEPVRRFRNYMHPDCELKDLMQIEQSTGQLALACLNALIEKYTSQRFVAEKIWKLEYGLAQIPADNLIQMPQIMGDNVSLLVSELPAERFREMSFLVLVPPGAVFNFVYSYLSLDQWRAARIDGREGQGGGGYDNGQVLCAKWRNWVICGRYTNDSEPSPKLRQHEVRVVLEALRVSAYLRFWVVIRPIRTWWSGGRRCGG